MRADAESAESHFTATIRESSRSASVVQCELALAELHKNNLTTVNVTYLTEQLAGLHAELDSLQRALAQEHRRKPTDMS